MGKGTNAWQKYKEEKAAASTGQNKQSVTVTDSNSGSGASAWEDYKKKTGYSTDLISSGYIQDFATSANNFFTSSEDVYNGMNWSNATRTAEERRKVAAGLDQKRNTIKQWLTDNQWNMSAEDYKTIFDLLDSYDSNSKSIVKSFDEAAKNYAQFDSQEAYDNNVAYWKDYNEKSAYDVAAGQKEIEVLEEQLKQLSNPETSANFVNGMPYAIGQQAVYSEEYAPAANNVNGIPYAAYQQAMYAPVDNQAAELRDEILRKKQYLNQAKQIQRKIAFESASGNKDFVQQSVYVKNSDNLYNWINDKRFREEYEGKHNEIYSQATGMRNDGTKQSRYRIKNYDQLTADEIKLFNYYYATEGAEKAQEYLDTIQEDLNMRSGKQIAEKYKGKTGAEIFFGVSTGLDQFGSGMRGAISGITGKEDYIPQSQLQYAGQLVREDLADNGLMLPEWMGGGSLAQSAYDLTSTTANMAPSILVSIANPLAGSALMGTSAAGNAYQTALNAGYDKAAARSYGVAIGVAETAMQSILGGISSMGGVSPAVTKAVEGIDSGLLRFFARWGASMASEGLEEGLQEVLDPILQNAILGADENVDWANVVYSALLGAASAGVLEIGGNLRQAKQEAAAKREYGNKSGELVAEGLSYDTGTEANELAQQYKSRTDSGKELTGAQIKKLLDANEVQSVKKAAKERLVELGETDDPSVIAELATKWALGEKLKPAERSRLARSKFGARVAHELKPGNVREDKVAETMARPGKYKPLDSRVSEEVSSRVSESNKNELVDSGKEFDLKQVDAKTDSNGKLVWTVDGQETTTDNMKFKDEDTAYVFEAVENIENITPTAAPVLVRSVDTSKDIIKQLNGLDEAYTYGNNGYTVEDMNAGEFTSDLTDTQKMDAFRLGEAERKRRTDTRVQNIKKMRTAAEAEAAKGNSTQMKITYDHGGGKTEVLTSEKKGLTSKQKAAVQVAEMLHKLGIGTDFEFFSTYLSKTLKDPKTGKAARVFLDENGNEVAAYAGVYMGAGGKIRIDLNAYNGRRLALNAMSHELVHFVQDWSPEKYQAMAEFLASAYGNTELSMHQRVLREQARLQKTRNQDVPYSEAYDEVVANALNKMFDDGTIMTKLAELRNKDAALADKIIEGIRIIAERLLEVFNKNQYLYYDTYDLMQMGDTFKQIQNMFAEALVDASDNLRAARIVEEALGDGANIETNENGELLLATNENRNVVMYSEQIKNVDNKKPTTDADIRYSSQETDADSMSVSDVVTTADGSLAVNINSRTSGLLAHRKGEWPSVIAKQIRSTLAGKLIYAADGDIITVTNRGAREVAYGDNTRNLKEDARNSNDYSEVERKMFTAEHAATIIALSVYKSWSKNTDPTDGFKRDGLNHRTVKLLIDGEPYVATVLTALSADETDKFSYGEKFYDILGIEKQTNQSATSGDTNTVPIPHTIKFADDSSDKLTVTQKKRIVNRKNAKYTTGDADTTTAFAAAFANAKSLKSSQETDPISNRHLLANAFETISRSSVEYGMVQDYKQNIDRLNKLENELSDVNAEIRQLRFGKDVERDPDRLRELEDKAESLAKEINKYDKRLINMEASEPLRKVLERERKKARQRTIEHTKQIQQNRKMRKEQTELRKRIRRTIMDLDKILNKGTKHRNVKDSLQAFVEQAIKATDVLFMDDVKPYDMIRSGFTTTLTEREKAQVEQARELLDEMDKIYGRSDANNPYKDPAFIEAEARLDAKISEMSDIFERENMAREETTVSSVISKIMLEYKKLEGAPQIEVRNAYSDAVYDHMSQLASAIGNTRIKDMSTDQLQKLYEMYNWVKATVTMSNKFFADNIKQNVNEMATQSVNEFKAAEAKRKKSKFSEAVHATLDQLGWNNEKVMYALRRMDNSVISTLMQNIINGEDVTMRDVQDAIKFRKEIEKKHNYKKWDFKKTYTFEDKHGKKFEMTLQQMLSFYAYSRRDAARDHIGVGGVTVKTNSKLKMDSANAHAISDEGIAQIESALTEEQRAYVRDMQSYLSDVMGAKGNEVSLKLYGIKMFNEESYFPIRSSSEYLAKAGEANLKNEIGITNMASAGFTKSLTPHATTPIEIGDFIDTWANHVNEMSRYHGFVLPMEDFRRVFNFTSYANENDSTAVRASMKNAFGEAAVKYFDDLYRDLNSAASYDRTGEKTLIKLFSRFKKSAVMYSLSVVVQQPTAIVRAGAMIDRRYFGIFGSTGRIATGLVRLFSKNHTKLWNEMMEYAPGVTTIKEIGGFDTATGGSILSALKEETYEGIAENWNAFKQNPIKWVSRKADDNFLSRIPAYADQIAWVEIWNAVKRETVATHKDLTPNSKEFFEQCGKRFSEVIRMTQVYDSVFAKSPQMRSKVAVVQMLTSFMSEPNTTINMAEDGVREMMRGNKRAGARTLWTVAAAITFNNLIKSIVYAMRDDDEDQNFKEKYLEAVIGGMLNDINPLNYIPFARDVWSVGLGYDVERPDMTLISDLAENIAKVSKLSNKDTSEMDEEQLAAHEKAQLAASMAMVDSISALVGFPIKNIRRDIKGFINTFFGDKVGESTKLSIEHTVEQALSEATPTMFRDETTSKTELLYNAIMDSDAVYVERLKSGYKDEKAYTNAVRKALRENDERIHEAAQALYKNNASEYKRIYQQIRSENKFSTDDILNAIDSEAAAIQKDIEGTSESSPYSASDFVKAVIVGDTAAAKTMQSEYISYKVSSGNTKEEAEKKFREDVQGSVNDAYMGNLLARSAAKQMLIKYVGKDDDEAEDRLVYWDFKKMYPEYNLSESAVLDYYDIAEPLGISINNYAKFAKAKGGKRDEILTVIDSLDLSDDQKDALYFMTELAESKLWNTPWH